MIIYLILANPWHYLGYFLSLIKFYWHDVVHNKGSKERKCIYYKGGWILLPNETLGAWNPWWRTHPRFWHIKWNFKIYRLDISGGLIDKNKKITESRNDILNKTKVLKNRLEVKKWMHFSAIDEFLPVLKKIIARHN